MDSFCHFFRQPKFLFCISHNKLVKMYVFMSSLSLFRLQLQHWPYVEQLWTSDHWNLSPFFFAELLKISQISWRSFWKIVHQWILSWIVDSELAPLNPVKLWQIIFSQVAGILQTPSGFPSGFPCISLHFFFYPLPSQAFQELLERNVPTVWGSHHYVSL